MSRARPWTNPATGDAVWFDRKGTKASVDQIQLLADAEGIDVDDLLDEGLGQRQVIDRLHALAGSVPEGVLLGRLRRREEAAPCVICPVEGRSCEGIITRHHYVPRWLMLLLENYQSYAARSRCCIPVCLSRHRDLHIRGDEAPKSIVGFLTDWERSFAEQMLGELREQKPVVFDLLAAGDDATYEGQLVHDYLVGKFR